MLRSAAALGVILVIGASAVRLARADGPDPAGLRAQSGPLPSGSVASIIVIAEPGQSERLRPVLVELLDREGVRCELSEATHFDPNALFAGGPDDPRVLVFVVIDAGRARLYFRGPGGDRFMLRRLALPRGLDEVGIELVGHVVSSSTRALLRTAEGLSREQASAEIEREAAPSPSPSSESESEPEPEPDSDSESEPELPARPSPLGAGIALRYAALAFGEDLGLAHGPGLELWGSYRGRVLLRLRGSAERWFAQSFAAEQVETSVQTFALRAVADVGLPLAGEHAFVFGLGGGVDLVRSEPRAAAGSDVRPVAESTRAVPTLRGELRYERAIGALVLAAGVLVDVSLADTHYDLLEAGTRRRIVEPWLVRPGAALALGFGF